MTANETTARDDGKTLKEALLSRRMLICVFTGFASGLPLYLLFQMVPYWLRAEGVGLKEIGYFALIQFPYTWKFLWAPLMDRFAFPVLGHRRGWMLVTQVALLSTMAALGFLKPEFSLGLIAYLCAAVAFFSASQDIMLDAYRRELLADAELGLGNSIHVQAYRLSGLIPGGLALILSDFMPWHTVFIIVALFMGVGIVMTLVIDEAASGQSPPQSLRESVIEPFREFIGRSGWRPALFVLAFLFFYKLGDNMATALQTPFFRDVGFSGTQIGTIAKFVGTGSAIVGGFIGVWVLAKISINRALWLFGFVQIGSILGFALLSVVGANPWMLAFAMAFEYLGVGLGSAGLTAFMARSTNVAFAATQFALFTALISVPRVLASATTGLIVEQTGWTNFFLICTLLAVPGMLLLFKVAPWNEP